MNEISVCTMEKKDISEVSVIESKLFADAWNELSLENTLSYRKETSFVVKIKEKIVGYIFFMVAADEAELLRIGVLPEFQRCGAATLLMQAMLDYVKKNSINSIWLEVREHNNKAIALYNKFNFENKGIRKNYYKDPKENAVIMCRS